MDASVIDRTRLESFLARAVGDLSAGYGGVMVSLGSKLGLYRAMSGAGPISSKELAALTGCAERYVSEWLNAQAAGGYVGYHAVSDTYELSPEQAMLLADENSPVFIPHAWQVLASMWLDDCRRSRRVSSIDQPLPLWGSPYRLVRAQHAQFASVNFRW